MGISFCHAHKLSRNIRLPSQPSRLRLNEIADFAFACFVSKSAELCLYLHVSCLCEGFGNEGGDRGGKTVVLQAKRNERIRILDVWEKGRRFGGRGEQVGRRGVEEEEIVPGMLLVLLLWGSICPLLTLFFLFPLFVCLQRLG